MFAVPGWSVSSSSLKTEVGKPKREKSKTKKRKSNKDGQVDAKRPKADARADGSSLSTKGEAESSRKPNGNDFQEPSREDYQNKKRKLLQAPKSQKSTNHDFEQKRNESRELQHRSANLSSDEPAQPMISEDATKQIPSVNPSSNVKLTPLQSAMRTKLMGSRFRHLNESLYTKSSSESMELFGRNPNLFEEYHAGFRQQVSTWPGNPVDSFLAELGQRGKVQGRDKKGKKSDAEQTVSGDQASLELRPLPRTQGLCKVADLGCGDASLVKKVKLLPKHVRIVVDSYDLQSTEAGVIKADIANLPVKPDSVNVAVLCLALMGTNWIDFIEEAWRILHWKGELWVAEIKSRFSKSQRKPPNQSIGKKRKPDKQELKKQRQQEEEAEAGRAISEMDGNVESANSTDVSGFVAVLRKRGFDLADEQSVDLSNKMFVRLKFVKSQSPVKGKCQGQGAKKKNWREMLREGMDDEQDENGVLQPCLYKVR